jgi:hypothetical protein
MAEGLRQLFKRAVARRLREWADDVLEEPPAPIVEPPSGTTMASSAAPPRHDDGRAVGDGDGAPRVWLDYIRERAPHLIVDGRFIPSRRGEPALEPARRTSQTVDAPRAPHDLAPPPERQVRAETRAPAAAVAPGAPADPPRAGRERSRSVARPPTPTGPNAAEIVEWPRGRRGAVAMPERAESPAPARLPFHDPVDMALAQRPPRLWRRDDGQEGAPVSETSAAHRTTRAPVPAPPAAPAVSAAVGLGHVSASVSRLRPAPPPAPAPRARPTVPTEVARPAQRHPTAPPAKDLSRPSMPDASLAFDRTRPPPLPSEPRELWPTLPSRALPDPHALAHDLETRARRARLRREQMGEP